ncbi:MAG: hypothetical protein WCK09_18875 [Bacteroidota bacterium]
MRDFTLSLYDKLLCSFKTQDYLILPPASQQDQHQKAVILRHDIDAMPVKALSMAKIENKVGIRSSWFFKSGPGVFVPGIVREMASLNHEIGYHYEDLVRNHGNYAMAISDFERNLGALRKVFPVTMICADGNPWSKYNNLWLWEKYDYRRFGITCEMYLDIDYNEVAYFTDTGRCWDGQKYNVWDHVKTDQPWPRYHTTFDIIRALDNGAFPAKAAFNIHPQRWNDNLYDWAKELVLQNAKNVVKLGLLKCKLKIKN